MGSIRMWAVRAIAMGFTGLGVAPALPTHADVISYDRGDVHVRLDVPGEGFSDNPTFYRLRGQSAFIQSRTSSGTSGGQLDGAVDLDTIAFIEVFPEANLLDYLTYSYLGIVELVGTSSEGDTVILDTSLVIGFNGDAESAAVGATVDSLYPPFDEATLVDRFTNSFDSPEFLEMAFTRVGGQPDTSAAVQLWSFTIDPDVFVQDPAVEVRSGGSLSLIAFNADGDLGRVIGDVGFSMTRVTTIPQPASAALLAAGALLLARRRG